MKTIQNLRAVVDSQLHVRLSVFQFKSTGLHLVFHVGYVAQCTYVSVCPARLEICFSVLSIKLSNKSHNTARLSIPMYGFKVSNIFDHTGMH
jgi:hypothetical protein